MSKGWNYVSGDWWITCDSCGKKLKASESKKRWDGFQVCPDDWEERQPLDFIRARMDKISVSFQRPLYTPPYEVCTLEGVTALPGYAIPGCMTPGNSSIYGH